MRSCELRGSFDGLFSVDCPIAYTKMFPLPKLLILLVASSDGIPVVALPSPTRVASSLASIITGHARVLPLSTAIANTSQPVLSIRGPGTTSPQLEHQQQQTADPAPYDTSTGILGPTDDASSTVDVTKSTIASSQMSATATLDATTSAEAITPGSSSSAAAAELTSIVRFTIMVTSTVGADAAKETLSVSLPSNDTSVGTTPPTSSFPTATTMAMAMTTESAEIECLNDRAATPKSHRYSGSGSRGHKSYDRCQSESSSAVTSSLAWWEMTPAPPALLLWAQSMIVMIGSVYAIAKTVLGCKRCCSQPRDSTDLACEISSARAWSCSVWYGGSGNSRGDAQLGV